MTAYAAGVPRSKRDAAPGATTVGFSQTAPYGGSERIDFAGINAAAIAALPELLARWLPDGRRQGAEWVATNPTRTDRRRGSFSVNMRTGRWADFATGDRGRDVVSLAAYLHGLNQGEAARKLAAMLGLGQ